MHYRQVHLDFHTSEKIKNIGSAFDKKEFQEALKRGHVNSITLFSKCHHGWSYHPTMVNEMHPGLDFDLLAQQISAAHEIGVKTPVYISAGLDERYALKHRGDVVRNKDESTTWVADFLTPGYHKICMNTPYLDFLLEQIKEMLDNYDADGLFLDISNVQPCYCERCMNQMISEGKNPENISDVIEFAEKVYENYAKRVRDVVDEIKPGLPVFHNGGHIQKGRRDIAFSNSHLEIESLPTGGYGYEHFPVSASYARTLGVEYCGMTGKFHQTWGEFGGFKHPNALRYETALSLANGAACSIGDQLHPDGMMDKATYELIGKAYEEVELKEKYISDARNIADIGVFSKEAAENGYGEKKSVHTAPEIDPGDLGCVKILTEGKFLFNYIDIHEDFGKYKVIILPDKILADEILEEKLIDYVKQGGKVLASGISATDKNGRFVLDFGAVFDGKNDYCPDYLRPGFELQSISNSAYVMFYGGYKIKNITGKILGERENPYFNRTIEHFSSHQHAPNDKSSREPAIVGGDAGIYIGWNIFEEYANKGTIWSKEIVCNLLDRLIENKSVITNLPSQGVITLMHKENEKIVHLLYASPVKRGRNVEIIEDIIPIFDTDVSVFCTQKAKKVYLAPQGTELNFVQECGYVRFKVDKFECHQMVLIEFSEK